VTDDYEFPVIRYPSVRTDKFAGYRTGLPFTPAVARELKRLGINILHSHCPFASSVLARTVRLALDAPIVFTYHTKFDIDIANTFKSEVLQTAVLKVMLSNIEPSDEVWVVSPGAEENLRQLGYTGDCLLMENGVDFPQGPAPKDEIAAAAARHGINAGGDPVFLFVGRMMWYKGIRTILDGLYSAKSRGIKFRMIFIGGGLDFDSITETAGLLGLSDDCVFTGPVGDRGLLRAYYSLADLFLFPSSFDTSGIVVREAAACGLASVLLRGSSAAHGVGDARNGVLIDDSASDLAEIVAKTARDRGWVRALGRQAGEDLYLSWNDAVGRAWTRYGEILENYRPRSRHRGK
jgi:glycosyltransferase involved in cell wall biosynthesis